jgi:cellular nucleic acid-binding protein
LLFFLSLSSPLSSTIHTGTVKWFNVQKGFGFIVPTSGPSGDVFVHQTSIKANGFRSLADGEEVEFKLFSEDGKVKAVDVTGPGGEPVKGSGNNMGGNGGMAYGQPPGRGGAYGERDFGGGGGGGARNTWGRRADTTGRRRRGARTSG